MVTPHHSETTISLRISWPFGMLRPCIIAPRDSLTNFFSFTIAGVEYRTRLLTMSGRLTAALHAASPFVQKAKHASAWPRASSITLIKTDERSAHSDLVSKSASTPSTVSEAGIVCRTTAVASSLIEYSSVSSSTSSCPTA